jgi:hypothetical protein
VGDLCHLDHYGTCNAGLGDFAVMAERWLGISIFDPANGGDPILFQHLFWFYLHSTVYIMVLPAMGVVCHARSALSSMCPSINSETQTAQPSTIKVTFLERETIMKSRLCIVALALFFSGAGAGGAGAGGGGQTCNRYRSRSLVN